MPEKSSQPNRKGAKILTLEKGMATHSSILAWEIPWTEEPGGLQSTGSQRIRRDFATKEQQSLEITPSGLPMIS